MIFQNRAQAGELLARQLTVPPLLNPVILAVPRGGAPVGAAIAKALDCPFDIIPLIKIPIPWSPEASYGVVAMDGTMALNKPLIHRLDLSERELELAAAIVLAEAKRREGLFRQERPFPALAGKTVVITDDGLASGYSMLAAVSFTKKRGPRLLIVASPVASDAALRLLKAEPGIDRFVIPNVDAEQTFSLSSYYKEFKTLTDDDVMREVARTTLP